MFDSIGADAVAELPADFSVPRELRFRDEIQDRASAPMRFLVEVRAFQAPPAGDDFTAIAEAAIAEVDNSAAGTVVPRYFGDGPFTTAHDEVPADRPYYPRVRQPLFLRRRIAADSAGFAGVQPLGAGEVRLTNLDGGLDGMVRSARLNGRLVRVLAGGVADRARGERRWRLAEFAQVFRGTATEPRVDGSEVVVPLRDVVTLLDVPFFLNQYAGSGGAEGGTALQGKRKPIACGRFWQVTPPLVDAANNVYQLHDGPMESVTRVSDRGNDLVADGDYASYAALAAATITAGRYATSLAAGMIRTETAPAGILTVDGRGGQYAGADGTLAYRETTAEIVDDMLRHVLGIPQQHLVMQSFADLAALQPAPVGYWFGPDAERNGRAAANLILRGAGCYLRGTNDDRLAVGRIDKARGTPVKEWTSANIRSARRVGLPAALEPAVYEVRVGYEQYQTRQLFDLETAVTQARRQQLAEQFRFGTPSRNATVLAGSPQAVALTVSSCFALEADAEAEQDRLLDLLDDAELFEVELADRPFTRELGDVGRFTFPLPGLEHGPLATIVGDACSAKDLSVTLEVLVT